MKDTKMIKVPCETCLHKGTDCFSSQALIKTALSMEVELYNHRVQKLVSSFTLPCDDYISGSEYLQKQFRKIV